MPIPTEIMAASAALQNDTERQVYTDVKCLPYLNIALGMLQEEFQLNDIPSVLESSAILTVPAETTEIGFTNTIPILPNNLIEIKEIYESISGQNDWSGPLSKEFFITPNMNNPLVTNFGLWAWVDNKINIPPSVQINDLKINFIKSIFPKVAIGGVGVDLGVQLKNCETYLIFMTAALCSLYIGENPERAITQSDQAGKAILRSMGISVKSSQVISVRRRPFRAGYKSRNRTASL